MGSVGWCTRERAGARSPERRKGLIRRTYLAVVAAGGGCDVCFSPESYGRGVRIFVAHALRQPGERRCVLRKLEANQRAAFPPTAAGQFVSIICLRHWPRCYLSGLRVLPRWCRFLPVVPCCLLSFFGFVRSSGLLRFFPWPAGGRSCAAPLGLLGFHSCLARP